MRLTLLILLFQCFTVCIFNKTVNGKETDHHTKQALRIVKQNNALLDSVGQLLVVFNETSGQNLAVLVVLEKKDNKWKTVTKTMPAGIGRKGFAAPGTKREGDNHSPTGFFRLGQLFCYDKVVNTMMPFIQTTSEDKWIDDPNSSEYNRHIRGNTQAKSYENLKIRSDEYKYCMVIEYNMHPVVKGMGSAIFIHLSEKETINPSSGCIVLTQQDMEWLLNWMNPDAKPAILMGNEKVLIKGIKK